MKPGSLFKPVAFAILAAYLVSGCSRPLTGSGAEAQTTTVVITAPGGAAVGANAAATFPAAAGSSKTLRIRIPARQADASVRLVARNGEAETYMATDDISVSYRQGILIATRGLGADLMAGDAEATLRALRTPATGTYSRQMRYLTSNHQSTWIQAGCDMKGVSAEVRGGRTLSRYEESCVARTARFTNIYWLDRSGQVVASRQWVSAAVVYLESDPADR